MEFSTNYINDEVLKLTKINDIFIKYPGFICDFETLQHLLTKNYKILLHGISPSSGSLFDPNLCNKFDEFSKCISSTNQRWLSFHFDYSTKFFSENYIETFEKNLNLIKSYFPNLPILIENMPFTENKRTWCTEPEKFNEFLEKYDLNMLLDIAHARVSCERMGITFEDYISKFNLSKVLEIHISGAGYDANGLIFDAHTNASEIDYKNLEFAINKCKNLKMITLEFIPDFSKDNSIIFEEQQYQIQKIKNIAEKLNV